MTVGMADLHKAITSAWDASTLEVTFNALWSAASTEFFALNDQDAPGNQPFPYVVMDQTNSNTIDRMSSCDNRIREVRDVEVRFNIFAREIDGDSRSSKAIAAYLAEEIMKVFGGHPTTNPTGTITLDNGNHLITTYQNGFGIKVDEDICQWVLVYIFRLDVPVAV
jgi:hypothetical protein